MPGSDPQAELGGLWVSAVAENVESRLRDPGKGKPVVSLERLAALYPAAGPRDVMQRLWDSAQSVLNGPVVVHDSRPHRGVADLFVRRRTRRVHVSRRLAVIRRDRT